MKRNIITAIVLFLLFFMSACNVADEVQTTEDVQNEEEVINIDMQPMYDLAKAGVSPMNEIQGIVTGYFIADEPDYYRTIFRDGNGFLINSEEDEELFWAYFGNWSAEGKEQIGQIDYDKYSLCVRISTQSEDLDDYTVEGMVIGSEDMFIEVSYTNSEYGLNIEFSHVLYAIVPNEQLQTSACESWIDIESVREWEPIALMRFYCTFTCKELEELGLTPEDVIMLGEQYNAQEIDAHIYMKDGETETIWLVLDMYDIDDAIRFYNDMNSKLPDHYLEVWKYECTEDNLMRLQSNQTELNIEFRIKEDTDVQAIKDYVEDSYALDEIIEEEILSFKMSEDTENSESVNMVLHDILEEPYTEENYNIFYTKISEYQQ